MNNYRYLKAGSEVKNLLSDLNEEFYNLSEMELNETEFLSQLILDKKPKKILEIGVSSGTSSYIILKTIKNIPNAKLYSIDLNTQWYRDLSKKSGHFLDNFPDLKSDWTLYTGDLSYKFIDEIGGDIDFCLFDTAHHNPGEILDVLTVLPYVKNDAIFVFHDTKFHCSLWEKDNVEFQYTNNLLMSSIYGEKILDGGFVKNYSSLFWFPNIGAIQLTKESKEKVWEIFNLLTLRWQYLLSKQQFSELIQHYARFYNQDLVEYFSDVVKIHEEFYSKYIENIVSDALKKGLHTRLEARVDALLKKNIDK